MCGVSCYSEITNSNVGNTWRIKYRIAGKIETFLGPSTKSSDWKSAATSKFAYFLLQTFGNDKQRLALRFRPQNVYDKPAFGDGSKTSGVLFKIKIRRPIVDKDKPGPSAGVQIQIQDVSIVGVVNKIYKFNGNSLIE